MEAMLRAPFRRVTQSPEVIAGLDVLARRAEVETDPRRRTELRGLVLALTRLLDLPVLHFPDGTVPSSVRLTSLRYSGWS